MGTIKVRVLRGCLHMPGPCSTEGTSKIGAFHFQSGVRDVWAYEKGDVFAWPGGQDELDGLVARRTVAIVADDSPVSPGQHGDKYTMTAQVIRGRLGGMLIRHGKSWITVASP